MAKGLCSKHYKQIYRHGTVLQRTIYDSNDFIIHKEERYCEIVCYDKFGNIKAVGKIDLEDYELVKDYKWTYLKTGYLAHCASNTLLHRLIMKEKIKSNKDTVDHINRDKLDNRKSNLRIVTIQVNLLNKGLQQNNTSGARGIKVKTLKSGQKVYEARIGLNGKDMYLGRFKEFNQAILKRKEAERELFGRGVIYEE